MRRRWIGAACGALLAVASAAAHALPIAVTSHVRSVAAEGSTTSGPVSDSDAATALGAASLDVVAPPQNVGAWAAARATLESDVSTSVLYAVGEALSFATAPPGQLHLSSAESLYRVEFTATADVSLRLTGSLTWSEDGPSDAFAYVELSSLDAAVDPLLVRFTLDGPGTAAAFDEVAALRTGVAYRLVGFVRTGADALGEESPLASGGFALALAEVPEPGTLALVAAGLALLARRRT